MEMVGRLLSTAFPPAVSLHCFGSSANGLGTSDSDLDLHLGKIATIMVLDRSSSVPDP
jgi:DNA polymerase sigma